MIDIVANMIVEWVGPDAESPLLERVLWCDTRGESVIVISIIDPHALPITRSREELESAFAQKDLVRRTVDPYAALSSLSLNLPAKHFEIRDRSWEKICRLVVQEPDIYHPGRRKRLILADPAAIMTPLCLVYQYLRKFWIRGMIKNALLPDYGKCGAPGKVRGINTGIKRGRKPKITMVDPSLTGVNVDENTKNIFEIAIKQYFNTREKHPLRYAYNQMCEKYYNLGYRQQGDVLIPILAPDNEIPTFGQFAYWYGKQKNLIHSIVSREGRRAYEQHHRPLLGSSTQMAFGPGSIFQIDATIADIYLVCAYDRTRIIGRPVVYFCIDVFSRMCVGLYVGLEGPSWLTGMMALANATTDKVFFCAEFGIEIAAEDWPCSYLPEQIIADRGEFIGISSDHLVDNLNIPFANCAPYRGDLKGIVERSFRRANDQFIKWTPGAVRKREQGDPDYRLEAKLTLHEFTKILTLMTIEYNLFNWIEDYPLARDMMSDGVEPIPIKLWEWGISNRTGHLRGRSQNAVKLALLPRAIATITERGVKCNGMFYSCERAISEQWFVKARQGRWSLDACYDPRKPEIIYLDLGNRTIETCQLLAREERFTNLRVEEIMEFQESMKLKSNLRKSNRRQSTAEFNAFAKATINNAIKSTNAAQPQSMSKNERTSNVRANRNEEKERVRKKEAWDLRQTGQEQEEDTPPYVTASSEKDLDDTTCLTTSRRRKFLEAIERSERGGKE